MAAHARQRLVVDVETIGCDWDRLSEAERDALVRRERWGGDAAAAARERLALGSLTAEVVAIGLYDPDIGKGRILLVAPARTEGGMGDVPELDTEQCRVTAYPDEAAVLRAFWQKIATYLQMVTFNGRTFDGPVLMHRSIALAVAMNRNLVGNRYHLGAHLDLSDVLTAFGAVRPYPLDFWCRRLGIPSPKTGGDGRDVERLWRAGEYAALVRYLFGDLVATAALLDRCERTNFIEGPNNVRVASPLD